MKKKILIILSIWVILSTAFGIYYMNFGPKPLKLTVKPIKFEGKTAKEPFKTVGLAIAEIKLNKTQQDIKPFIKKMNEFGATNIIIKTEANKSIISKTLPPVTIAGKKYKNKKICTAVLYEHKGTQYAVGNCK